jgi:hypothetical protein
MDPASEQPEDLPQALTNMASTEMASSDSHQAAANAILNTNELLCDIIIRLPLEDIVVATGVCQTWRKALKNNAAIQQALFLAPVEISDIRMTQSGAAAVYLPTSPEDIPRPDYMIIGKYHTRIKEHSNIKAAQRSVTAFELLSSRPLSKHPNGSWREMFVSQPPIKSVTINTFAPSTELRSYTDAWKSKDFGCETGVKMGELHDFCQSALQSNPPVVDAFLVVAGFITHDVVIMTSGGRWEVRNGKVCRQTRPLLIELPHEGSDEGDYSDGPVML